MERIAFHLEIQDGQREAYRQHHQPETVHDDLIEAYLDSGAGIETYSVFEGEGHVFGFMEVEEPQIIKSVMESSDAQAEWDLLMDPILEDGEEWLEEVYRMV